MKKLFLLMLACVFVSLAAHAQVVDLQKTYTITKKSKKGALANVEYNSDKSQYTLTYMTKANDKMVKFEIYTFDRDFNFVDLTEDIIEFDKAKAKYKWFNYRGEEYSVIGNYVEPNLAGTLVIRKKKITYKYDWWNGGYYTKTDVLEKVKIVGDAGEKLYYYGHLEDDETGDILVFAGIKGKLKEGGDPSGYTKNFSFVRFNKDLAIVSQENLDFEYPQMPFFKRKAGSTSESRGYDGMFVVFAPMGGPGMGKTANPSVNAYTYVRTDHQGKIIENIPFSSPASYWTIHELVEDNSNKRVYLYGPAAPGKDKYYNMMLGTQKFESVQLMCIEDGKVRYLTDTNLETIESKSNTPPSQKKTPEYKGKQFQIKGYASGGNQEFIVVGQNFTSSKKGMQYESVLGFHFDQNGVFKSLYGINPMETNSLAKAVGVGQELIETADKKKMIWFIMEVEGVASWNNRPLAYPTVGAIDIPAGKVSDFKNLGLMGKNQYFVDQKFPILESDNLDEVVLFGSDKKGAEIWFTRVLLK